VATFDHQGGFFERPLFVWNVEIHHDVVAARKRLMIFITD
jgi:hypothetical protein